MNKNPKKTNLITLFKKQHLQTSPAVNISACVGCGQCKTACKTKAIDLYACMPLTELPPKTGEPRQRPEINRRKCARCYRCQSECPKKAIETYKPRLMRFLRL